MAVMLVMPPCRRAKTGSLTPGTTFQDLGHGGLDRSIPSVEDQQVHAGLGQAIERGGQILDVPQPLVVKAGEVTCHGFQPVHALLVLLAERVADETRSHVAH
ncbi:hypothetical protein [Fodinicurvata halophila]|uniref:hypothetical protein n=1 Tax=Fodinicurvata halophila TaxID=1419723 RepID=UPI00363BA729